MGQVFQRETVCTAGGPNRARATAPASLLSVCRHGLAGNRRGRLVWSTTAFWAGLPTVLNGTELKQGLAVTSRFEERSPLRKIRRKQCLDSGLLGTILFICLVRVACKSAVSRNGLRR